MKWRLAARMLAGCASAAIVCIVTVGCTGGADATPSASAPAPTTPAPVTPAPVTPAPATPSPAPSSPAVPSNLVTVTENTAGHTATSNNAPGQSFTVHASYDNLRFNWIGFSDTGTVAGPLAFGTAYLLSQEYLGTLTRLNSATPGFVAASVRIESEQYVFAPTVSVESGRRYWVYSDTLGNGWLSSFGVDVYAEGDGYVCNPIPGLRFHTGLNGPVDDVNFRLTGAAK